MSTSAFRIIAAQELQAAIRGKTTPAFAVLFAFVNLAIALGGLGASGRILVQGFPRTAVASLNLSLYLMALLALIAGAAAWSDDTSSTGLLLAQPVSRRTVLFGRLTGQLAALGLVLGFGFGTTGLVVASTTGTAGVGTYAGLVGVTGVVAVVALALGALAGIVTRTRTLAVGAALTLWLGAAVAYDLMAIAVLQVAGASPGPLLTALLALNPIDGLRTVALVWMGGDVLLGPTGAALRQAMGPWTGTLAVLLSAGAWAVAPLAVAAWVWERRDF